MCLCLCMFVCVGMYIFMCELVPDMEWKLVEMLILALLWTSPIWILYQAVSWWLGNNLRHSFLNERFIKLLYSQQLLIFSYDLMCGYTNVCMNLALIFFSHWQYILSKYSVKHSFWNIEIMNKSSLKREALATEAG